MSKRIKPIKEEEIISFNRNQLTIPLSHTSLSIINFLAAEDETNTLRLLLDILSYQYYGTHNLEIKDCYDLRKLKRLGIISSNDNFKTINSHIENPILLGEGEGVLLQYEKQIGDNNQPLKFWIAQLKEIIAEQKKVYGDIPAGFNGCPNDWDFSPKNKFGNFLLCNGWEESPDECVIWDSCKNKYIENVKNHIDIECIGECRKCELVFECRSKMIKHIKE